MLDSIEIRNFKAIGDEPLKLEKLAQVNYLVGENGCGKSSVLEALHLSSVNYNKNDKVAFVFLVCYLTMSIGFNHLLYSEDREKIRIKKSANEFIKQYFRKTSVLLPAINFNLKTNNVSYSIYEMIEDNTYFQTCLITNSLSYEYEPQVIHTAYEVLKDFSSDKFKLNNSSSIKEYIPDCLFYSDIWQYWLKRPMYTKKENEREKLKGSEIYVYETKNEEDKIDLLFMSVLLEISAEEYNYNWFSGLNLHNSSGELQLTKILLLISRAIIKFEQESKKKIILIDEPESFLHPSHQKLIPIFLNCFTKRYENLQFLISTHSPFIISAAGELVEKEKEDFKSEPENKDKKFIPSQKVYQIEDGECKNPSGVSGNVAIGTSAKMLGAGLKDVVDGGIDSQDVKIKKTNLMIYCEGSDSKKSYFRDDEIYQTIFGDEVNGKRVTFVSCGSCENVQKTYEIMKEINSLNKNGLEISHMSPLQKLCLTKII